ncbi:MAG: ferredoxin [Streptosporangiaceae bacterium]
MTEPATRLRVNPIACSGHGVCAELLPELISLDEWGYPVLADADVPGGLARAARRAVTDCPALALTLRGCSEDAQTPA